MVSLHGMFGVGSRTAAICRAADKTGRSAPGPEASVRFTAEVPIAAVEKGVGCILQRLIDPPAGIVMAATPEMTNKRPTMAMGDRLSPRNTTPIATPIGTRR